MKKYMVLLLALALLPLAAFCAKRLPVDDSTPDTQVTEPSGTEHTHGDTAHIGDATEDSAEPSINTSFTEPATEPTAEMATEPTFEPTAEPTAEPTTEPTAEPTTELTDPTDDSSTGGTEETTQPSPPTEGAEPPEEAKLNLAKSTLTLEVGATSTLSYAYTGSGKLSWSSSDPAIASVSNGKVTAKSAGTVTITLSDGKLSDTCNVTVNAPAPTEPPAPSVGELTMNTATDTVVYVGSTLQIDYTYTGDKSALTFKSDDTSVLTVNNSGVVTGVGEGQTRVRVYHGDTQVGRLRLIVEKKPVEESKPEAKSIAAANFTGPYFNGTSGVVGNYMTFITAAITTEDTTQAVVVTSSNSGVASVKQSDNGNNRSLVTVSFKGAGSATITITSEDGKASASYTVNVKGGYSSAMGGQLTPEQFASCVNGIIAENGANVSTSVGYRVLTLTTDELTGSRARSLAESWVREHWPNGVRSMGMSYQGVNEDGKHVFYFHR